MLRWAAGFIVWATIILVIGAITVLAYLCYNASINIHELYQNLPTVAHLISEEDSGTAFRGLFYALAAVDVIVVLALLCMINRITLAIGIIKESSKVMLKMPTLLLVPFFIDLALVPLAIYFIYIGAYLGSAGTPTYDANGNFEGYKADETLRWMQLYHLFGGYWTLNFVQALGDYLIAGAVASWYWVHDKHNTPSAPVLRSLWYAFRYHSGSLLFGALILSVVQFIRFLLSRLEQSVKGKENTMTKFFFKCVQCILSYFERFIKFLNQNAYIMIAIYGYSFCEGARRGFELIASNFLRVSALNCVSGFLLFLGKLFVCMLTTLGAFIVFTRWNNEGVDEYILPLIVISILAYAIAVAFFGVFDMACDTLLLCFCEDSERNDGSDEKPYFMSSTLQNILDHDHTCGLRCCSCC